MSGLLITTANRRYRRPPVSFLALLDRKIDGRDDIFPRVRPRGISIVRVFFAERNSSPGEPVNLGVVELKGALILGLRESAGI